MSIKKLILVIINSLVIFVVVLLSISFYYEFSKVLDNRILQQLQSIKILKKQNLERLINSKWNDFDYKFNTEINLPKDKFTKSGIYDITNFSSSKYPTIGLVKFKDTIRYLNIISYKELNNILTERTGMGQTGESYLVGDDFKLRSQSRFFPTENPNNIIAKTQGVINGLKGKKSIGVFQDYRGIKVYSAYQPFIIGTLNWVILSEIDQSEVIVPLKNMRKNLYIMLVVVIMLSVLLSLAITKIITDPVKKIQTKLLAMGKGDYQKNTNIQRAPSEIMEMNNALEDMRNTITNALDFSVEIGNMNLETKFKPRSKSDLLGKSLIKMRDKLQAFRLDEKKTTLENKKLLISELEKERKRLSRELHDGIGPLLTSLKLYTQNNIENDLHKSEIKKIIDNTIVETRLMTNSLMPTSFNYFGIGATLNNYIENLKKTTKIIVFYENQTKNENSNIKKELEINLFRIVQELINNTFKHAEASQIRISLSEFDDFISLYYFDNGLGFSVNQIKSGSGISNIKERVAIFDGDIIINSQKNKTIFEIEIPI